MSVRAFSDIRDVVVTFNASQGVDIVGQTPQEAMSIDAYKAAINQVQIIEGNYLNDPTLGDLTAAPSVFTGSSRYKLYSFTLTTVMATGSYEFIYVETVPNAASLS